MTVRELIEHLKTLDQNAKIKVYTEYSYDGSLEYEDVQIIKQEEEINSGETVYVIYTWWATLLNERIESWTTRLRRNSLRTSSMSLSPKVDWSKSKSRWNRSMKIRSLSKTTLRWTIGSMSAIALSRFIRSLSIWLNASGWPRLVTRLTPSTAKLRL